MAESLKARIRTLFKGPNTNAVELHTGPEANKLVIVQDYPRDILFAWATLNALTGGLHSDKITATRVFIPPQEKDKWHEMYIHTVYIPQHVAPITPIEKAHEITQRKRQEAGRITLEDATNTVLQS